jgi:short-subunit dehydrogenase
LARELERQYGVGTRPVAADLSLPETSDQLVSELERAGIAVDFLVNNAGHGIHGPYRNTEWRTQREFLQVMAIAPCELVHRVLPGMTRRRYGRIVNMASVAGLIPGMGGPTLYGASKAMLISFSQALHSEQRGTGVHITALCPGFTYTEFHDVTGTREAMNRWPRFLWLQADRVAEEGYRAVMRNQAVCVPGLQYKTIVSLVRRLPMRLVHRVAATR